MTREARGSFSFEEAIWRELDQMRGTFERALVADADSRRELRDTLNEAVRHFDAKTESIGDEVSDLKISVAELRRNPPRQSRRGGIARDAGCTVSGATLGAIIAALVQAFNAQPPPAAARPQPPAIVAAPTP